MQQVKKIGIMWEQSLWGGVDTYLKYFLNNKLIKEKNIEIVLFVNLNNQGFERIKESLIKNELLKIVFFKSFNQATSNMLFFKFFIILFKPILFLISLFQSYFLLKKYNFDIFIGQCGGYGDFRTEMAGLIMAKFCNIPVRSLVIHHECVPSIFWNFFLKIINNFVSKSATSIISVSKATQKSLFYKSNLLDRNSELNNLIIYNGVPFFQDFEENVLEKFNNNFHKKYKLGILSRIEAYKGHEDLIRAISLLPLDIKNKIIVYFIGSGKSDEIIRIKKIIKIYNLENIFIFTGYLNFNSQSILRSLDLSISLTRTFEGFNYSVAESISVGTPVLCTDVGGIKEYLNNNYVEVVQPGNIDEISFSIINFCTDSKKWKERAVLAKKYIIEKYNSDQMVLNYLNHFNYHLELIKYKE